MFLAACTENHHPDYITSTGERFMDPTDKGNHWIVTAIWDTTASEEVGRRTVMNSDGPGEPLQCFKERSAGEHLYTKGQLVEMGKWPFPEGASK
jgi:hypothetical protein